LLRERAMHPFSTPVRKPSSAPVRQPSSTPVRQPSQVTAARAHVSQLAPRDALQQLQVRTVSDDLQLGRLTWNVENIKYDMNIIACRLQNNSTVAASA